MMRFLVASLPLFVFLGDEALAAGLYDGTSFPYSTTFGSINQEEPRVPNVATALTALEGDVRPRRLTGSPSSRAPIIYVEVITESLLPHGPEEPWVEDVHRGLGQVVEVDHQLQLLEQDVESSSFTVGGGGGVAPDFAGGIAVADRTCKMSIRSWWSEERVLDTLQDYALQAERTRGILSDVVIDSQSDYAFLTRPHEDGIFSGGSHEIQPLPLRDDAIDEEEPDADDRFEGSLGSSAAGSAPGPDDPDEAECEAIRCAHALPSSSRRPTSAIPLLSSKMLEKLDDSLREDEVSVSAASRRRDSTSGFGLEARSGEREGHDIMKTSECTPGDAENPNIEAHLSEQAGCLNRRTYDASPHAWRFKYLMRDRVPLEAQTTDSPLDPGVNKLVLIERFPAGEDEAPEDELVSNTRHELLEIAGVSRTSLAHAERQSHFHDGRVYRRHHFLPVDSFLRVLPEPHNSIWSDYFESMLRIVQASHDLGTDPDPPQRPPDVEGSHKETRVREGNIEDLRFLGQ
ncbi:unnamed protein product [Amoebophrya sp. A25]|nr:unnamed protein product [Amoebophrya sp. A25]|eukprot:GSA25T00015768001.1